MARVYDGFDQRLERPVAVKILRPQTRALPNMCKRFQQEARIAARLVHPNIVAVLDYGEDDSSSYLIMERLPGTTLRDEIIRGPLPRQRVMSVMVETLAALAAAHKLGVVHRDIKPSNILLQDDGHAKITDFGIAKSFDVGGAPDRVADDLTMTGVVLGTPGYLAPERRSGQPATVQSDLFAVGAVMVEVLTGRRLVPGPEATEQLPLPFRDVARRAAGRRSTGSVHLGDRHAACHENPAGRRGTRPAAAPNHADVIGGGHPPGRCPQGCSARPEVLSSPPPARARSEHTRRRLRTLVAAAVVAALVVSLYLFLGDGAQPGGRAGLASSHHHAASHHTGAARPQVSDAQGAAITTLAASFANAGFPGDAVMAAALSAVGAQPPGAGRQEAAQQALALAQVLLAGGGITSAQYQDVVSTLEPTGATVPATSPTAPAPSFPGSPSLGRDHGHGQGGDQGDQS